MQVEAQIPGTNTFTVVMSGDEVQLMGCLDDAWSDRVADGPPGKLWYQNVDLAPALRAVASFTEMLARSNGLRLVLDSLDEMLRGPPTGDGLPRLPWKETEAYKILFPSGVEYGQFDSIDALERGYAMGAFDGTHECLVQVAHGSMCLPGVDVDGRRILLDRLWEWEFAR